VVWHLSVPCLAEAYIMGGMAFVTQLGNSVSCGLNWQLYTTAVACSISVLLELTESSVLSPYF
jgi:hypothetical protein